MLAILMVLPGCTSLPATTDTSLPTDTETPDTDETGSTGDTGSGQAWSCPDLEACFDSIWIRPGESGDFRIGAALVATGHSPPLLVVTAPGSGTYTPDFIRGASTHLFQFDDWPVVSFEVDAWNAPMLDLTLDNGTFPPATPRTGADAVAPGDLTGDGVEDVVLLETTSVGEEFGNVLVFPGPLVGPDVAIERGYDDADTIVLLVEGAEYGAPCGDLNSDGVADLCLSTGVILGPVTTSSAVAIPMTGELLRQNAPSVSPGFVVWSAKTQTLKHVDGVGPDSEFLIASETTAIDGAPFAWNVVPGTTETTVLYATEVAQQHIVSALRIGESGPFLSFSIDELPETLAYADVTGDGVSDVLVAAESVISVWDGSAALSGTGRLVGTLSVPTPNSGLGEEMLVTELHGGGQPELVVGAPRELVDTNGGPGALGSTYLLRLPLDPATIGP